MVVNMARLTHGAIVIPTPRPGHLAEIAMEDNGILLVCDSLSDLIYQIDPQKREFIKS
jgi:hypothetical protein